MREIWRHQKQAQKGNCEVLVARADRALDIATDALERSLV
jgi:hypothetical protein